jgi:hydrogenase maturation protease
MMSPYLLLADTCEILMTMDADSESDSPDRPTRIVINNEENAFSVSGAAFSEQGAWPEGVQVFCLGSPHGDDQVGWLTGDALRKQAPAGTSQIHFLNHAWQLAGYLDRCQRAILIDACCPISEAETGLEKPLPIGTIMRMGWPDERLSLLRSHSTHRSSVTEALELAATLDWLPGEVLVLGIVSAQFEPGSGPSPEIVGTIPQLVQVILSEVYRP